MFYSLAYNLLRDIEMFHLGLLHHGKLKPVSALLTAHNPIIRVSTADKLKYVPFELYRNYNFIRYAFTDRRLGPHTPKRDRKWYENHTIKHNPIWIQITIQVPSLSHTLSYIFISTYSLISSSNACLHSPKISSRDCTSRLFLLYPYSYAYSYVSPHSRRRGVVRVFTSS